MSTKAAQSEPKPKNTAEGSQSVSLRVRKEHVKALDKIADSKGIIRSAAIQIAIAEFIGRSK
jgi:predicted transcriptional regulator